MRKTLFLAALVMLATPAAARAQYWVEFNPGTCTVGPPPACVSGHWHPLQLPQTAPRAAYTPTLKASGEATDEASQEQQEQKKKKSTDISTDVEYESFSYPDQTSGTSIGLRGMYIKRNESGLGGGVIVTGERSQMKATFTEPEPSFILAANAFVSADLGERFLSEEAQLNQALTGQAGVSVSSFRPGGEGVDPINTYGPFATVQYSRFQGVFSYGASLTYSMAKLSMGEQFGGISQSTGSWALGLNGGYSLNEATFVSGDVYSMKGGLMVAGGSVTRSFSPTFGLTVGAKTLLGQDGFSNYRLTLGSMYRVR